MKKYSWSLLALILAGATTAPAQAAALLGAKAGVDFWYSDAKINGVRADDSKVNPSVYAAIEHFIPLVPNVKLRYTGVDVGRFNTNFDQYDLIAYYEILDNDMASFDLGINIQYFDGNFVNRSFSEWQPNLYADGRINIPTTPVDIFATFSVGSLDESTTVDAEAGALFNINLALAQVDVKVGYRIQDFDFGYFGAFPGQFKNNGFFAGVEIRI